MPRILLITDPDHPLGIVESVEQALSEGADQRVAVQLRAKSRSDQKFLEVASLLRVLTSSANCQLLINSRADIATLVQADGVHLPEQGLPALQVRELLGASARIGRSCHDTKSVAQASCEPIDYLTLGPFQTLPNKAPAMTMGEFSLALRSSTHPVLALGGVSLAEAPLFLEAGAYGMAVIRAVFTSENPAIALQTLLQLIDKHS